MERRLGRNLKRIILVALIAALLILLGVYVSKPSDRDMAEPSSDLDPEPPAVKSPEYTPEETAAPSPEATPEPTPEATPEPVPDAYTGPDVPEGEEMGDEFFADAAMLGNSLIMGMKLYSGLTMCHYYAGTGLSIFGVDSAPVVAMANGSLGTILDGLSQQEYGKIYMFFGQNEFGLDFEVILEKYSEIIDRIQEMQPEATIYIMGLTPVTAAKSSEWTFNIERIKEYNEGLYNLAAERECYYLDIFSALVNEEGYLTPGGFDGIHLAPDQYKIWLQYLRTHYIEK